jgi:hypothetical protein
MELQIKAKVSSIEELKKLIQSIRTIEKEHSCNCTLVDVEID